jgi:hypothetical protein
MQLDLGTNFFFGRVAAAGAMRMRRRRPEERTAILAVIRRRGSLLFVVNVEGCFVILLGWSGDNKGISDRESKEK